MKYVEEYLETVVKIKPLGELTTKEDELNGLSGEMAYIDGKCSDIFISHADYANWLESKYEQKSVVIIPKFRVGDEIKTSNEESLTITKIDEKGYWSNDLFICDFDSERVWDLVEQKSADKVKPKFHVGDWVVDKNGTVQQILSYKNGIYKHTNGYSSKMFEDEWRLWDPTEWHREDEQNLNACLGYIPDEFLRRWLQDAIHTRYDKPATWSEEDENRFNNLIFLVEYSDENKATKEGFIKFINKLKFIKQRYAWKPSNKQMEVLLSEVEAWTKGCPKQIVLESLYNDLKKLK